MQNLRRSNIITYGSVVRHIYSRSVCLSQPPELYVCCIQGSYPPNHSTFQPNAYIQTWGKQIYLPNHIPRNAAAAVCPVAIPSTSHFHAWFAMSIMSEIYTQLKQFTVNIVLKYNLHLSANTSLSRTTQSLKMERECSSKISATFYQSTLLHITEILKVCIF